MKRTCALSHIDTLTDGNSQCGIFGRSKSPFAVHSGLDTLYPSTNAVFSPDDKYVLTGAGAAAKGGQGRLVILAKEGFGGGQVASSGHDAGQGRLAQQNKSGA